jgi:hypothetical protein
VEHVPLAHRCEQHCESSTQVKPAERHATQPESIHRPPSHAPLSQLLPSPAASPTPCFDRAPPSSVSDGETQEKLFSADSADTTKTTTIPRPPMRPPFPPRRPRHEHVADEMMHATCAQAALAHRRSLRFDVHERRSRLVRFAEGEPGRTIARLPRI